jgi:hypothetical protein
MSIAPKNEKGYIEITDRAEGFSVTAQKRHAGELEALFRQHGIPCTREAGAEGDTLVFEAGTDRHKIEEILVGYEAAKGS